MGSIADGGEVANTGLSLSLFLFISLRQQEIRGQSSEVKNPRPEHALSDL